MQRGERPLSEGKEKKRRSGENSAGNLIFHEKNKKMAGECGRVQGNVDKKHYLGEEDGGN